MRVGWLGLGAMGAPMAAFLAQAGHPVAAYAVLFHHEAKAGGAMGRRRILETQD